MGIISRSEAGIKRRGHINPGDFRIYVPLLFQRDRVLCFGSIVLCVYLKIALGMSAGGAYFRGLCADDDVSAVAALPHLYFALLKHCRCLHVFQQGAVSLLMVLFDGAHQAEFGGKLRKSLLFCRLGEILIHVGPLIVFAVRGRGQVFLGIADSV